jgi:hypothetical protein
MADAREGVRLRAVRISGLLDLEAADLRCPLLLDGCYLDATEPLCLDQASASRVTLTRCQPAGLSGKMLTARELSVSGSPGQDHERLARPRLSAAEAPGRSCQGAEPPILIRNQRADLDLALLFAACHPPSRTCSTKVQQPRRLRLTMFDLR